MNVIREVETAGYCLLPQVFEPADLARMLEGASRFLTFNANAESILKGKESSAYGARNILRLWPECRSFLAKPALRCVLQSLLVSHGGLVRGLYFDKPPGQSWALPWHRDETIAVKSHGILEVFSKPTRKAGVPHVIAPRTLLEQMIAVRIHLDAMDAENGALKVIPGSHQEPSDLNEAKTIECSAGDVLLMRPLLLHSSGHSSDKTTRHRRIVHLECAPSPTLPDGYEWHDFMPITQHEM